MGRPSACLLDHLVEYWPLNEPNAADSAKGILGFDVAVAIGAPAVRDGPVKGARYCTNNNAFATGVAGKMNPGGDVNVSFQDWLYPVSFPANDGAYLALSNPASWSLRSIAGPTMRWSAGNQVVDWAWPLGVNSWHQIVGTYMIDPGGTDVMVLYVDGEAVGRTAAANTGTVAAANVDIGIGGVAYRDAYQAEIGVWYGRTLTPLEVKWLWNHGRGRTFPFDGRPSNLGRRGISGPGSRRIGSRGEMYGQMVGS